jgi:hypothetical protein
LDDSIRPQKVIIYRRGTPRVVAGWGGTLGADAPVALGDKKPDLWAEPTSRRRRPNQVDYRT